MKPVGIAVEWNSRPAMTSEWNAISEMFRFLFTYFIYERQAHNDAFDYIRHILEERFSEND